ncbi:hypothetical protein ACFVUW_11055 [Streptomyces xiamenensis]|uniref:hypothetical protein n=1 Tax=Streptomyces xiamenensis TaxID=408015 RepID=UPI0036E555C2
MRRDGSVRLITEDLSETRTGLADTVLEGLITRGWLKTSVAAVRAAVPGAPAAVCTMPRLAKNWLTQGIPRNLRKPYNGWVQRLVSHPLLAGQPAGVRLAALYTTAMSSASGQGQTGRRILANRCCFSSSHISLPVLQELHRAQWLSHLQTHRGQYQPISWRLAAEIRPMAPGATPAAPPAPAVISLTGRGAELARWTRDFYQRHGHAPSLRQVIRAHCTENPDAPWSDAQLLQGVQQTLIEGWVTIARDEWLPVRPGPAYRERSQHPPSKGPKREKKPAVSPRQAPKPTRRRSQDAPAGTPGLSPFGRGPDLPLKPTRLTCAVPPEPPQPQESDLLSKLLLIPGARAVLQPESET